MRIKLKREKHMIWFIFQTITVVSADGITAVNKTVKVGNSLLPTVTFNQ